MRRSFLFEDYEDYTSTDENGVEWTNHFDEEQNAWVKSREIPLDSETIPWKELARQCRLYNKQIGKEVYICKIGRKWEIADDYISSAELCMKADVETILRLAQKED